MGEAFKLIRDGIDVSQALAEVEAHPELWNAHTDRTFEDSPHFGTSDIWVRYRPEHELTSPQAFLVPHFSAFYPAWHLLPALRPIVFNLMARVEATLLGGILITKIPAGGCVIPHHDRGSWHAEFYNTKVYVPLKTNAACLNTCDGYGRLIAVGEAVSFNNLVEHSVENNGDTDRITLIVCMRAE